MSVSQSVAMAAPKRPSRGRAWLSGILITLSILMTPLAIVANWATMQVGNTTLFVNTLGPLASNSTIQKAIIEEVTTSIDDAVDIDNVTSSIIGGFGDALNLPDSVKDALGLVSEPIASGVKALIQQVVTDFVTSPAFQDAWTRVLTLTHEQTVALLSGDPNSMFTLSNDGTLSIPLKPIIAEIKASLVGQGVQIASIIPEIDRSIVIGQIPELAVARVVYQVGTGVGLWMPWVVLGMFIIGILVANRRPRALVASGIAFLLLTGLMWFGFDAGGIFLGALVEPTFSAAAGVVYNAVVLYARDTVATVLTVAIVMILAGWALSPSALVLREWLGRRFAAGRNGLNQVGATMGRFGTVLGTAVVPIRWLIVGIGVLGIVFGSPRTSVLVVTWTLVTLLLLTIFELLWRPVPATMPAPAAKPASSKRKATTRTATTRTATTRSTTTRSATTRTAPRKKKP